MTSGRPSHRLQTKKKVHKNVASHKKKNTKNTKNTKKEKTMTVK